MHVISTLFVLFTLFQHQTSRHFLLVHAITSAGLPVLADERDSLLQYHPSPMHDAFPESQQHVPKIVTSDSSEIAQNGAENNSNSHATLLRVEDVTSKSIKVRLETRSGASPLVPQKIFFKNVQRNSDWKHFVVDEKRHRDENGSVLLTNLLCGNKYQVYGASIDREGQTSASQVLLTKTAGREPLAPPASVFLTRVNRTSYRLNLSAWSSGGCPILAGTVEYRSIRQRHWTTLPIHSLLDPVLLSDLSPDELYKVRVTMKNSAGSTSIEYEIRSTDSKNVFQKNPSEIPHLISLGNFHGPAGDMDGPGHVTDVLIVTLTLLLTTLAAVAILYKTIQRKFSSAVESRSNRVNTFPSRMAKVNFVQNNVSGGESFAMQPSELSTVTLEKRFQVNKLTSSASDSGFATSCHIMNNGEGQQMPVAFHYLTTGRRPAGPAVAEEYAVIQKRDTETPRYSAPVNAGPGPMAAGPISGDGGTGNEGMAIRYCDQCGYTDRAGQEWGCIACEDKTPSALLSFRHHQMISDRL